MPCPFWCWVIWWKPGYADGLCSDSLGYLLENTDLEFLVLQTLCFNAWLLAQLSLALDSDGSMLTPCSHRLGTSMDALMSPSRQMKCQSTTRILCMLSITECFECIAWQPFCIGIPTAKDLKQAAEKDLPPESDSDLEDEAATQDSNGESQKKQLEAALVPEVSIRPETCKGTAESHGGFPPPLQTAHILEQVSILSDIQHSW